MRTEFFANLHRRYLFPLIIAAVVIADIVFYKMGMDPTDWIVLTYNYTAMVLVLLEFLIPRNQDWNYISKSGIKYRESAVETFFFFFSGFWASLVVYPFSSWASGIIREQLGIHYKIGLPLVLQAILLVFAVDFIRYWIHRWEHEKAFLWRFHALHHIPERLGTITSTRTHPIDDFLLYVPETILLMTVGFDRNVVAGLFSVIWVISLVKHSNLEIEENMFSKWFQIPRYHLRHHEYQDGRAPTYNFSEILTFWDRVFGTFNGDPIKADHKVGVMREKERSFVHEFFGSIYLKTDKL